MSIRKFFTVRNTENMNTAEKFRYNATMAVEGMALNYAGQCVAGAGIGMIEGGVMTNGKTEAKVGVVVAAVGGTMMVVGATNTMYHGYKAMVNAIDYSADRMNARYAEME